MHRCAKEQPCRAANISVHHCPITSSEIYLLSHVSLLPFSYLSSPPLLSPHLSYSAFIFLFISTFFSYFLLSSPRLIIQTCGKHRRTCLGIWINHGACVLEAFCAPCFYLCLSVCLLFFFSLMNIHPVSPLSSLSLSFSNLHIFFFSCSSVSLSLSPIFPSLSFPFDFRWVHCLPRDSPPTHSSLWLNSEASELRH